MSNALGTKHANVEDGESYLKKYAPASMESCGCWQGMLLTEAGSLKEKRNLNLVLDGPEGKTSALTNCLACNSESM